MDSLLEILKEIQLRTTETIIQLETVTLSHIEVNRFQDSLRKCDILPILAQLQGAVRRYGDRQETEENDEESLDTVCVKQETEDAPPVDSEVQFSVNVPASKETKRRRGRPPKAPPKTQPKQTRRVTRGEAKKSKIKTDTEQSSVEQEKNLNDEIEDTIQKIKDDVNIDLEEKDLITSDIRERWNQKLKEGIRKEDIECSNCGKSGFKLVCSYERHEQSHEDEKPFTCHLCYKTFKYKRCVDAHMSTVHSERADKYECQQCKKTFKQKYGLTSHMMTHSEKRHRCNKCSRSFTLLGQLKSHIRTTHQGIYPYWCKICNKGFKKKVQFEPHVRKHTGERPYECDTCSKTFTSHKSLNTHKLLHSEDFKYNCPICEGKFKLLGSFRAHVNRHSKPKDVDCKICGKLFYTRSNLKEHMLTHTGEKNHQCSDCGRTFATKSQLIAHLSSHANLKPFSCELCAQKFRTKSNLEKHTFRKHKSEAEQPFKCEYCAKGIATKVELTHHVRSVHTHERPYKCEECSMEFIASKHLRDHSRIHTGEKPYRCPICNKTFTQSGSLFKHKAVHDKQPLSAKPSPLKKYTSQQGDLEAAGFSFIPVQMPSIKVVQQKLPDNSALEGNLSIINENQQTLYELITQVQPQPQKLALSMHSSEQGTNFGQLVTTIAAAQVPYEAGAHNIQPQKIAVSMQTPVQETHAGQSVTTIATQVADQPAVNALLVQDPQSMHNLQTDFQQISYF